MYILIVRAKSGQINTSGAETYEEALKKAEALIQEGAKKIEVCKKYADVEPAVQVKIHTFS